MNPKADATTRAPLATRLPRPRGVGAWVRRMAPETLVFAGATTLLLLHALDDALLHRGPGVPAGRHALAAALALAAAVAAVAAFPRLRPGLRAALAFLFGALGAVNGALHVLHVAGESPTGSDPTGVLAAAAALVLVALAVAVPWRHRGERAVSRRRRWATRAVAAPAAVVGTALLVAPIGLAIVDVHNYRESVGAPPTAAYDDVTFRSTDGLRLAGWYRPSENGAAVVVVHGGGSDRRGSVAHAKMLARHGYGVLLYDARGRGESEGSPNSWGWGWEKDVAGAIAFLARRADVDPGRIGGLGISSGGDALLDAAATNRDLHAVVTDGAALRTFEDADRRAGGLHLGTVFSWTSFKAVEVLGGDSPPAALGDLVPRIASPLLLISAGSGPEYDFNVAYAKVARTSTRHWNLPDAEHTHGLRERPSAYEWRVVAFLDGALR